MPFPILWATITCSLMRNILLLVLLFFIFPSFLFAQKKVRKKFKLPVALEEVSGLVIQNDSTFWWHNDSGAAAQLFKTNGRGELQEVINLESIKNKDWEDLTCDDKGNIYIGEFGNNANKRKDLKIYIYNSESKNIDSISFHYPDQKEFPPNPSQRNFDMEAFFWFQDSLHLFSKNKLKQGNYYTKHYVLSAEAGNQEVILKDSIFLKKRVVTGAAIDATGSRIALVAYNYKKLFGLIPSSGASVFIFSNFKNNLFLQGKMKRKGIAPYIIASQYESIDFLSKNKIYIASEKTAFIRQKARRMKVKTKDIEP